MLVKKFKTEREAKEYNSQVSKEHSYKGTTLQWCNPIQKNGEFLVASHDGNGIEIEVY